MRLAGRTAGRTGRSTLNEEISVIGTGGGVVFGKMAARESALNLR